MVTMHREGEGKKDGIEGKREKQQRKGRKVNVGMRREVSDELWYKDQRFQGEVQQEIIYSFCSVTLSIHMLFQVSSYRCATLP